MRSQYVSCTVDAAIAQEDMILHALPLYHCAQFDVFFGPGIYMGTTNVITAKPVADNLLALIERFQAISFFAPPTVWIALLRWVLLRIWPKKRRRANIGAGLWPIEVNRQSTAGTFWGVA